MIREKYRKIYQACNFRKHLLLKQLKFSCAFQKFYEFLVRFINNQKKNTSTTTII